MIVTHDPLPDPQFLLLNLVLDISEQVYDAMCFLTGGSALYHTTSTGVTGTHAGLPETVVDWCSLKQSSTPVYQQLNM